MELIPWSRSNALIAEPRHLLERFFDDPWRAIGWNGASQVPPVEVFEHDDEVVVRAEVAGIDPQDLDVRVEENSVTIRGERRAEDRDGHGGGYYRSERQYGTFVRTVALPDMVDPSRAQARFRHGLLEVHAPRRGDDARYGRRLDVQIQ